MARSHRKLKRSEAQIRASQENGKKSSGPKDTSKTRLNAIKHGILSDEAYCDSDAEVELYVAFEKGIFEDWGPETQSEHFYAERVAQCMWRLRLIQRRLTGKFARYGFDKCGPEFLLLMARYERQVSRELTESEAKLRELQAERRAGEAREGVSDETNPSDAASPRPPGPAAEVWVSPDETLRCFTRAFEVMGKLPEKDQAILRTAALTRIAEVMPELALPGV